jgi:nucleoside-diphosphate-sugar epimerase/uncharacterized membrane protein
MGDIDGVGDAEGGVVLITGATGFIGSAVVRRLGERYRIVALDRAGPPDPPAPADAVDFDLASDDGVASALATVRARYGHRIASVVHLAAYYDITGEPNPLYDKITVEGTRRLIEGLGDFEVEQFIFASTMLVHRATDRPDQTIDEDAPIEPAWAYPESKVRTETLLRERHGRIPVVFLRIAGVYDDEGHQPFIAEQIARIYEHRLIGHLYPGMLCAGQSFVHLDDLTDAVARLVERRASLPPELPLLVGEPEALGYAEVQDIIGRTLHGEGWTTLRIPQPLAKLGAWAQNELLGEDSAIKPWMVDASSDHYVLDITRARTLLGWQPQHRLAQALPKMVAALKRDPQGWYRANKLNPALVAWYGKRPASRIAANDAAHSVHGTMEHGGTTHAGMSDGAVDRAAIGHAPPDDPHAGHSDSSAPGEHVGTAHADAHAGHMAMMERDERRTRWAHVAAIGLGAWLAASPLVYDATTSEAVSAGVRAVTAERGLPSVEWRANALMLNDLLTGLAIMLFGVLSLSKRTAWFGQWANAFAGIWLLFVPLLFWTPSAAHYLNTMIVGAGVIALAVLVPMMPGMSMAGMMDPKSIPPGWTYSPSTDAQRLPIVVMGLIGLLISRHLTAYQLGHIDNAWEPFFMGSPADPRNGTEEIITSEVSRMWPIPDAGLGAVSYLLEILMAVMGTRDRWRTMPWMVTFFGILVIPLGVISIYFIIIQPIVIGTWSTPTLIAALAMLIMIPFALDEVIAMGQFLYWARCRGKPLIRTFFKGDAVEGGEVDTSDAMASPAAFWRDTGRGVTLPWTLAASIAIGVFLMLTRLVFGTEGDMANSDHVVGALVITVAIIATAEVARALRFLNAALGLWLVAAPWFLEGHGATAGIASVALGIALIALSLPRGRRSREHYAGWDKYII